MSTSTPDWFEQGRRLVAGLVENVGASHQHRSADDPAAEAASCPVCAARSAWRQRRPDLLEGLADVLASTAEVLRASAARPTPDGSAADGTTTPGTTPDPRPDTTAPAEETVSQQAPTPSPVQRIDVA